MLFLDSMINYFFAKIVFFDYSIELHLRGNTCIRKWCELNTFKLLAECEYLLVSPHTRLFYKQIQFLYDNLIRTIDELYTEMKKI